MAAFDPSKYASYYGDSSTQASTTGFDPNKYTNLYTAVAPTNKASKPNRVKAFLEGEKKLDLPTALRAMGAMDQATEGILSSIPMAEAKAFKSAKSGDYLQAAKDLFSIGPNAVKGVMGEGSEFGDVGRELGVPEDVSAVGGLVAQGLNPVNAPIKVAGAVAKGVGKAGNFLFGGKGAAIEHLLSGIPEGQLQRILSNRFENVEWSSLFGKGVSPTIKRTMQATEAAIEKTRQNASKMFEAFKGNTGLYKRPLNLQTEMVPIQDKISYTLASDVSGVAKNFSQELNQARTVGDVVGIVRRYSPIAQKNGAVGRAISDTMDILKTNHPELREAGDAWKNYVAASENYQDLFKPSYTATPRVVAGRTVQKDIPEAGKGTLNALQEMYNPKGGAAVSSKLDALSKQLETGTGGRVSASGYAKRVADEAANIGLNEIKPSMWGPSLVGLAGVEASRIAGGQAQDLMKAFGLGAMMMLPASSPRMFALIGKGLNVSGKFAQPILSPAGKAARAALLESGVKAATEPQ